MSREWPRNALLLAIATGPSLSCAATFQWKCRRLAKGNPQVLYAVDTRAKAVALTIDDGPDAVTTPQILDAREARLQVRARLRLSFRSPDSLVLVFDALHSE